MEKFTNLGSVSTEAFREALGATLAALVAVALVATSGPAVGRRSAGGEVEVARIGMPCGFRVSTRGRTVTRTECVAPEDRTEQPVDLLWLLDSLRLLPNGLTAMLGAVEPAPIKTHHGRL